MTITSSGLFVATMADVLRNAVALDLEAENHRVALFPNTITPDFKAAAANARYGAGTFLAANEISGTGYTAGGALLVNTALSTLTYPEIAWTADDVEWPSSTLVNVRGALVYADAVATPNADPAIVLLDFENDYSTNNGTFAIQFASGIVFSWLLIPFEETTP